MLATLLALCPFARAELASDWLVGPGVRAQPAYDGSANQRKQLVPVLRILGEGWFARSTQDVLEGGWRMTLAPGLASGLQLAYEPGRKSAESALLRSHGVPDVARGASVGAQVELDRRLGRAPLTLVARVRQHVQSARGAQADLRVSLGLMRSGPFAMATYVSGTWANRDSTASFYGFDAALSRATGLRAYAPGGGLLEDSAGLGWRLDLGPDWVLVGAGELRHLHGGAVASPIVERVRNDYMTLGIAYRF